MASHSHPARHLWPLGVVSVLLTLGACDDSSAKPTPADVVANTETAASPVSAGIPDLAGVMGAYEACRSELAADSPAISDCAADLAKAAKSASSGSNAAGVAPPLERLAQAADSMATPTDDLQRARQAFAETSKELIAVLEASGNGGPMHHVFECAMVEGNPRWVQRSDKAANPYMGAKMLGCGAEVHSGSMHRGHDGEHEMVGHHDNGKTAGKEMHHGR